MMASPMASSSRLVLGGGTRTLRTQLQRYVSTSSVRLQEVAVQEHDVSINVTAADEHEDVLTTTTQQQQQENDIKQTQEQAEQKAFYDNLQSNLRQAEFDEARKAAHFHATRRKSMEELGSTQTRATSYRPHHERLTPLTARQLTVSHLLAATAHVGHAKSSLMRACAPFVYGTRHGQSIIDVEKFTLPALRLACNVVKETVYRDGVVVFIGTAEGTEAAVVAAAKRLGKNGFHIAETRWLPGTLSNASRVLNSAVMNNSTMYEEQIARQLERRGKDDASTMTASRRRALDAAAKTAYNPANIASQQLKPDLIVVLNPKSNVYAINEATQAGIPTIGVIDTDVDPRLVTYAIPANDESVRTAELIVGVLSRAGQDGLTARHAFFEKQGKEASQAARRAREVMAESSRASRKVEKQQEQQPQEQQQV